MPASSLPTRKIGKDNVSAIGFGAMKIAFSYDALSSGEVEERMKFLDDLHASGCTNWDTANIYGDSEVILGEWFKRSGKRNDIFLATKCGASHNPARHVNGEPEYVMQCMEKSLSRLQVDHVDLYYLHRPDPTVPIETTMGAFKELVKQGKVRYAGLSECSAATIRRAHAVVPISAIQVEYSLFTLDIERLDIVRTARELGIAVVAYSPLGRGLLTGRYKSPDDFDEGDFRKSIPRFSAENFPKIVKIVDSVTAIAAKYNATPGQIALAWLLEQGPDVIPIPGTRSIKYLEENLGALKVKLSSEDVADLRVLAEAADNTLGDRYPVWAMTALYAETPALA